MGGAGVITRKGQVTIPAEVRKSLGLREGDRVEFSIEGNSIRIVPQGSVAERTYGIIKTNRPPMTAEELREAAEIAIAEDVIERSSR